MRNPSRSLIIAPPFDFDLSSRFFSEGNEKFRNDEKIRGAAYWGDWGLWKSLADFI